MKGCKHSGATCEGCEESVSRFGNKCTVCNDYDPGGDCGNQEKHFNYRLNKIP